MLLEPARLVLTREDGTVDCGLEYLAWCRFFGIPLSTRQNKAEATKLRARRGCPVRRIADQPYGGKQKQRTCGRKRYKTRAERSCNESPLGPAQRSKETERVR